jgi:hypothetical protein
MIQLLPIGVTWSIQNRTKCNFNINKKENKICIHQCGHATDIERGDDVKKIVILQNIIFLLMHWLLICSYDKVSFHLLSIFFVKNETEVGKNRISLMYHLECLTIRTQALTHPCIKIIVIASTFYFNRLLVCWLILKPEEKITLTTNYYELLSSSTDSASKYMSSTQFALCDYYAIILQIRIHRYLGLVRLWVNTLHY